MEKYISSKKWWLVGISIAGACFVIVLLLSREGPSSGVQPTRDDTITMPTDLVQNERSPDGAADLRADSLELASALHALALKTQEDQALTGMREAYELRRSILGRFDTNTYSSLAALAGLTLRRSEVLPYERTNALALLLELRLTTTNLFSGQQAGDLMPYVQTGLIKVYELLGWQAEKATAEKDLDLIFRDERFIDSVVEPE